MTQERPEQSGISTEVVGAISEIQQQELAILGGSIVKERGMDLTNPEHIQAVTAVVEDCIYRGLKIQRRTWFSRNDDISPIFELGFGQRQSIVTRLNRSASEEVVLNFITPEEYSQTKSFGVFDPDLSEAESLIKMLNQRKETILRLHNSMFVESSLSDQARDLKASIEVQIEDSGMFRHEDTMKNNKLYANLLANLALYRQSNLTLEPKDVAALSDIWSNPQLFQKQKIDLVQKMKEVASTLSIPESDVENYTLAILEKMSLEIISGQVTVETLQTSDAFALTTGDLQTESLEFEEDFFEDRSVLITEDDYREAQSAYDKVMNLFEKVDEKVKQTEDTDEGDAQIQKFLNKTYFPFFKELTPLDLVFIQMAEEGKSEAIQTRLDEELTTFTPFEIYVEALILLGNEEFKLLETGEEIPELKDHKKDRAYVDIKEHVMFIMLNHNHGFDYKETIKKLPDKIFVEYLNKIDPAKLTEVELGDILELDEDRWFRIATQNKLGVEADITQTDQVRLIYGPDTDFLRHFFDKMPQEKRDSLKRKMQHIVRF